MSATGDMFSDFMARWLGMGEVQEVSAPESSASASQGPDAEAQGQTLYQIICNSPQHTILRRLIDLAGKEHLIDCAGPHAVFAPTDCAFTQLTLGESAQFILYGKEAPLELLNHILRNHIVDGCWPASKVVPGLRLHAESAHTLIFYRHDKGLFVNVEGRDFREASQITQADLVACDGVLHVVDRLLLEPPCTHLVKRTVWDIISNSPVHTTLTKLICVAGLKEALQKCDAQYTVFAPVDAAFACIPKETLAKIAANPELVKEILAIHVLGERLTTYHIQERKHYQTLGCHMLSFRHCDKEIYVVADDADIKNPKAIPVIAKANLLAENGVVHAVDRVISIVKANLIQKLTAAGHFTKLLAALCKTGLDKVLVECGHKFTIFAPTDKACFDLEGFSEEQVKELLLSHVLKGRQLVEDLPLQRPILTAGPCRLVLTENCQKLYAHLAGSEQEPVHVHCVDMIASNGVIHSLDAVLLPGRGHRAPARAASPVRAVMRTAPVMSCNACSRPVTACACHHAAPPPKPAPSCNACAKPVTSCACSHPAPPPKPSCSTGACPSPARKPAPSCATGACPSPAPKPAPSCSTGACPSPARAPAPRSPARCASPRRACDRDASNCNVYQPRMASPRRVTEHILILKVGTDSHRGEVYETHSGERIHLYNGKQISEEEFDGIEWEIVI